MFIKYMKNNSGFTLIELIVVITIISIITVSSVFGYNYFIQGVEMDQSRDNIQYTYDQKKLEVINGQHHCSELMFFKDQRFFLTLDYDMGGCSNNIPLVERFALDKENDLNISVKDTLRSKITERKISNQNFLQVKTGNQGVFTVPVDDKVEYTVNVLIREFDEGDSELFVLDEKESMLTLDNIDNSRYEIYECLEISPLPNKEEFCEKNHIKDCTDDEIKKIGRICDPKLKEKTLSLWNMFYYTKDNSDKAFVAPILASKLYALDLNNQILEGKVLNIKFEYPDGDMKTYLDKKIVKKGGIELTKISGLVDPFDFFLE